MTEYNREELEALLLPVMKYLEYNFHPHVKLIVDCTRSELVEGLMSTQREPTRD
tara:strand:+ start:309 stop:470 length:162 start_codon:yes stop_codon:yes gene_type:complete